MATDLSSLLPNISGADATSYGTTPGFKTLDLSPDGSFSRIEPAGCSGCTKSQTTHKSFTGISVGPQSAERLWSETLSQHAEAIRDNVDMLRTLIHYLYLQAHGVLDADQLSVNLIPPSNELQWKLVSASGDSVVCEMEDGRQDPRAIQYQSYIENPDWGQPGEGYWTSSSSYTALRPGGILTFKAPSQLQWHGGWIVYAVDVPDGFTGAVGDQFTLKVLGPLNDSLSTTPWPTNDTDQIEVGYRAYYHTAEVWPAYRHHYPLYVVETTFTLNGPIASANIITAAIVRPPATGWFSASWLKNGEIEDKTSAFTSLVSTTHSGASAYLTLLDLTGIDLTGVTKIYLTLWEESSNDNARSSIQNRCANALFDPSGSWGDADNWYCGDTSADLRGNFRPKCFQTPCSGWTEEAGPTNPVDQTVIQQLLTGVPWRVLQYVANPTVIMSREECPSLMALATSISLEKGMHTHIYFDYQTGGWVKRGLVNSLLRKMFGWEWDEIIDGAGADAYPEWDDSPTWPDRGPAGETFTQEPGACLVADSNTGSDADDPARNRKHSVMTGSVEIMQHTLNRSSWLGLYQLTSYIATAAQMLELWFPNVAADGSTESFADGTFRTGFWTAEGIEQGAEDGNTVYYWKLSLSPRRADLHGGGSAIKTAIIDEINDAGSDVIEIWLRLGAESASTQQTIGGIQVDQQTHWQQGGNVAALPSWARVHNHESDTPGLGVQRLVQNGDVIEFPSGSGFTNDKIKDRRFMVRKARPCADSSRTGSFIPSTWQESFSWIAFGRLFYQFTGDETVDTLTIKRDLGGTPVPLTERANNEQVIPTDLAKDEYYWEYYNEGGLYGILVWFSPLQDTGVAIDYSGIQVEIVTDADTYDDYPPGTDILQKDPDGWEFSPNLLDVTLTASANISSIASVVAVERDGTVVPLTAHGTRPTNFDDWDTDKYYATAISGTNVTITVSPARSGCEIYVTLNIGSYGGNSDDYYDAYVAIHDPRARQADDTIAGALPYTNHKEFADRFDQTDIQDEESLISDAIGEAETFVGRTVKYYDNAVAHWRDLTIRKATYDDASADTDITGSCFILAAHGEIFGIDNISANDCLIVRGRFADRNAMPKTGEINGLRTIAERIIGE